MYVSEIVPAGRYSAQFQLRAGASKCESGSFDLVILEPSGALRDARARISLPHLNFFEGRDTPPDESYYHGGKWWKKVDVSRFQEIQKILDDFPDSEYAQWIRFWKLYHHGPVEEALAYARANPDFPLSDNLMLRIAEGFASKDDDQRAREIVGELQRLFPDGDATMRAAPLRQRLEQSLRPTPLPVP